MRVRALARVRHSLLDRHAAQQENPCCLADNYRGTFADFPCYFLQIMFS